MALLISCPKPFTGVKCFDCSKRETCPQLNPPVPKPKHYARPVQEYSKAEIFPTDHLEKHVYRMLLLLAEDFLLTTPEKKELMFYASRFPPFSKNGGRGKSKERVYACLCLYLLERDKRPIYVRSKDYYDEKYALCKKDCEEMKKFILKELKKFVRRR